MKCQKSSRVESRSECLEQSEASEVNGHVVCAGAVIGDCADIVGGGDGRRVVVLEQLAA